MPTTKEMEEQSQKRCSGKESASNVKVGITTINKTYLEFKRGTPLQLCCSRLTSSGPDPRYNIQLGIRNETIRKTRP